MLITLPARQPFSFHAVLHSHGWMQLRPFHYDPDTAVLHYVTRLSSGRTIAIELREAPGGVQASTSASLSDPEQQQLARQVAWMFSLDQDLSAFYAAAQTEPRLAHVQAKAQGRVLRSPSLFEDVIKTVLTTNTLWSATIRMCHNLVEQFGQPLEEDPDRKAFPAPESLAATSEDTLRAHTRLGYRAPYVLDIARTVASGAVDLEALKSTALPTVEVRKKLLALKGVGGYAAANLLMLLGRGDTLPVDSWALKMVSNEWHNGQPVTAKEVEAAFADWGAWKGLAYFFWDWQHR